MVTGTTQEGLGGTVMAPIAWIGVTGLQCELRHLFLTQPAHRALGTSLRRIAQCLGARYAVATTHRSAAWPG